MAKPINKNMGEIIAKYRSGQYRVNELARMYGVDKATISRFIKNNSVKVNQHAKNAGEALVYGMKELKNAIEGDSSPLNQQNTLNQQGEQIPQGVIIESVKPPIRSVKDLESANVENIKVASEVIEYVKKEIPEFAKGFEAVGLLILQRSMEILQNDRITAQELSNIAKATQIINDTLNIFPKAPTFAQQININEKSKDKENKKIDLNIKFV